MSDHVPDEKRLTTRQKAFINAYLGNGFNARQAALTAGYAKETAFSQATRILNHPDVKAEIDAFMEESAMSAKEALARLSAIARGDIGDIWDEATGAIDWQKARAAGKTGLIKHHRHKTIRTDDTEVFEDEIELHDPLKALQLIGKQHGLFVERKELTGKDGGPIYIKSYKGFSPDEWDENP
jgi:phage terminase small subunit